MEEHYINLDKIARVTKFTNSSVSIWYEGKSQAHLIAGAAAKKFLTLLRKKIEEHPELKIIRVGGGK